MGLSGGAGEALRARLSALQRGGDGAAGFGSNIGVSAGEHLERAHRGRRMTRLEGEVEHFQAAEGLVDCGLPMDKKNPFLAYHTSTGAPPEIVPAPIQREWMQKTREAFANRCLPLLIANQAGWLVLSPHDVRAVWDGTKAIKSVCVEHSDGPPPYLGMSHFGEGILTFSIPFLFRTPPGYNLLVRGPANMPKDGAFPLDGIVETDWTTASFTMNWQLTRPQHAVTWKKGEPIAMLVPVRRGELESFEPELRGLYDDPEIAKGFLEWRESRSKFIQDLPVKGTAAHEEEWQKDYVHGRQPDGTVAKEHQRKLALKPFRKGEKKA